MALIVTTRGRNRGGGARYGSREVKSNRDATGVCAISTASPISRRRTPRRASRRPAGGTLPRASATRRPGPRRRRSPRRARRRSTSKVLKARSIGWPMARPTKTSTGAMSNATWALEPTAMFTARSIRFFIAMRTAELCSAALPMIGTMMRPTKISDRPMSAIAASVDPTRISESHPTMAGRHEQEVAALGSDQRAPCSSRMRRRHDLLRRVEHGAVGPHRVDEREGVADDEQHRHADRDVARQLRASGRRGSQ